MQENLLVMIEARDFSHVRFTNHHVSVMKIQDRLT